MDKGILEKPLGGLDRSIRTETYSLKISKQPSMYLAGRMGQLLTTVLAPYPRYG